MTSDTSMRATGRLLDEPGDVPWINLRSSATTDGRALTVALVTAAASLLLGRLLDFTGLAVLDPLPYALAVLLVLGTVRQGWGVAAAVLLVAPLIVDRSVMAPESLSTYAPLAAAGVSAVALVRHPRSVRPGLPALAVLALALLLVLPALHGADVTSQLKGAGVGLMWVLSFVLLSCLRTEQRRLLGAVFVVAMTAEALVAMSESFLQLDFTRRFIATGVGGGPYVVGPNLLIGDWATRSFGTVGHPIPLSLLLVLAIVLLVGTWSRRRMAARIALLVVLLGGIAATGARSALLVALAAAVVLALAAARRSRRRRLTAGVLAAVLAILSTGVAALLIRSITSDDFSLTHRGGMVQSALGLLQQPLDRVVFGFGYNAPVRLHAIGVLGKDGLDVVDNTLVTQTATAGVLGLLVLLALLIAAFVRGGTIVRAGLAAFVASMLFFDLQSWHLVMTMLWAWIAAGLAPEGMASGRPGKNGERTVRNRAVARGRGPSGGRSRRTPSQA